MPPDPWTFGSTELLTIAGHLITIAGFLIAACVALRGIRKFDDWKKEQIEQRRIEVAVDALALAYEARYIFEIVRSPGSYDYEWKDIPSDAMESPEERRRRGPFYAVRKRIIDNKDFFDLAFKLQPRCMALFGEQAEAIFMLLHRARRHVEVATEMLANEPAHSPNIEPWAQLRRDIWYSPGVEPEKDRVTKMLNDFTSKMEVLCRPVIDRELKRTS